MLQIEITDPKGRITRKTYDALGNISEVVQIEPLSQKILSQQQTFYDAMCRPIKTVATIRENGTFIRDYVNEFGYYFNEKVDSIIEGSGSENPKRTRWNFLAFGQKEN